MIILTVVGLLMELAAVITPAIVIIMEASEDE